VETLTAQSWSSRAREMSDEGWLLMDLTALDRLGLGDSPRFEVVVQLLHMERRERVTLHISAEGDPPTVPSITPVWPTGNFMEREVFDLFGVHFEGHPNLTRIMMPDEWEGHPLRKDYGVGKVPVQFKPQPFLQIDRPGQSPVGARAGTELDELGQVGEPLEGSASRNERNDA
jgi:NADH-quinone oxidoreductase subunit C